MQPPYFLRNPLNCFWMPEPIFTKLGMYVMAPEPISTAYFINPFHHSCLHVYRPVVASQPRKRICMQQKNCGRHLFLCDSCPIKGKYKIRPPQRLLYKIMFTFVTPFLNVASTMWFLTQDAVSCLLHACYVPGQIPLLFKHAHNSIYRVHG
jgi:hypothetical protein